MGLRPTYATLMLGDDHSLFLEVNGEFAREMLVENGFRLLVTKDKGWSMINASVLWNRGVCSVFPNSNDGYFCAFDLTTNRDIAVEMLLQTHQSQTRELDLARSGR